MSKPSIHAVLLQVGLEKLLAAEGEVNVMKQELIDLQPKLIETGEGSGSFAFHASLCTACMLTLGGQHP